MGVIIFPKVSVVYTAIMGAYPVLVRVISNKLASSDSRRSILLNTVRVFSLTCWRRHAAAARVVWLQLHTH